MNASDEPAEPTHRNNSGSAARVWLGGHDSDARRRMERRLADTLRPPTGALDAAFITPKSIEEAVHFATKLRDRLPPGATLTVVLGETTAGSTDEPVSTRRLRDTLETAGYRYVDVVPIEDSLVSVRFTLLASEME